MARPVDARSDIFSLGVVLFEMATGQRPHGASLVDIVSAMARPAPRADAVDSRVPAPLADVIARALEIEPDSRFQSAADVEAALESVLPETRPGSAAMVPPVAWRTRVLRFLAVLVATPVLLVCLSLISTVWYNVTLQRPGAFGSEPLVDHLRWGVTSNLSALVFGVGAWLLAGAARFLARLVTLVPPVARGLRPVRLAARRLEAGLGLRDPNVLAQALATIGVTGIGWILWQHNDLVRAIMNSASLAPRHQLLPLAPGNLTEQARYGMVLDALQLAFILGVVRTIRLRGRASGGSSTRAVTVAAALLAVVMLMQQMSYRILWQNTAERIDYAGTRCYVIGRSDPDWLIYCPDAEPPRNREVRQP
jgi:hypothetical protein